MKKLNNNKNNFLIDKYIIFVIYIFILFFKSILQILEIFSYGFLKKELLTRKSNIGFDMKIKIK